jgi:iron complex outermembrane receptor protein
VEALLPLNSDGGGSKSFSPLSPGIGLNYEVNSLINIFGSVRHGFSAPSVEESLMPDGSLNRDLGAEQGWNYDLGVRINVDPGIYYELSLYYIDLTDLLITRRFTEEIFYGVNAGRANYMGMETFLRYSFSEALDISDKSYSIILSYNTSQNRFEEFVDDDTDHSGNILPGIPDQEASIRLQLRPFYALEFLSDFTYTGRMYLNDENTASYGDWNTFDLKLNYRVKLKETQIKFYFGIKNLFNQKYASMVLVNAPSFGTPRYYYPGLPVNYFLGFRIER